MSTIYHWITLTKNTHLLIGIAVVIFFAIKSLSRSALKKLLKKSK